MFTLGFIFNALILSLWSGGLWLIFRRWSFCSAQAGLRRLAALVDKELLRARRGTTWRLSELRHLGEGCEDARFLAQSLLRAAREGCEAEAALKSLRHLFQEELSSIGEQLQGPRALTFRLACGIGAAIAGRMVLLRMADRSIVADFSLRAADATLSALSCLLLVAAVRWIYMQVGVSWTWNDRPSQSLKQWFKARLFDDVPRGLPVQADFSSLKRREILLGINLRPERQALLEEARASLADIERKRHEKLMGFLPLVELLLLCVASTALLLIPALQYGGQS